MCSEKKSLEIADRMEILLKYPPSGRGRITIAEMIQEICPSDKDADRLFREIREAYNSWPGPQEFSTFARSKMRPAATQRPELQEWQLAQEKPPDCERCADWGHYRYLAGVKRCDCEAGRSLPAKVLKLAEETAAAEREEPSPERCKRIDSMARVTAAEIASVMRQKRERAR